MRNANDVKLDDSAHAAAAKPGLEPKAAAEEPVNGAPKL